MSTKQFIKATIEDYSFTNKVIQTEVEKDGSLTSLKTFVRKELSLKKQPFIKFITPVRS